MRKLKVRLTGKGKYDVACSIEVQQYFSSQEVGDTPLKAYLIMATVSYRLSIYRDVLSGVRQFLTFNFLSTSFSVLQFLRCQNMNYLILEFKK